MPPRITRLKWPRLFPPHEAPSLPFLYPRWYTVDIAGYTTTTTPQPQGLQEQDDTQPTGTVLPEQPNQGTENQDRIRCVPSSVRRKAELQRLQERKRRQLREKSFYAHDWRTPLALLRKHTPEDVVHHVKQLERLDMPQGMCGFYPGDLSQLFVHIYLHTKCHVQVSRSDGTGDETFHALDLAGTLLSIRLAKRILNQAVMVKRDGDAGDEESMGNYTTTATSLPTDKPPPRAVWSMTRQPPKDFSQCLPPPVWSTLAFANHVEDLISSTPSKHADDEEAKDTPKPHIDRVASTLLSLFTDTETVRYASLHATTLTFQHLTHHRQLPQLRLLLSTLERHAKTFPLLNLIFQTPDVLNVCLHATAEARDLHNYNFLLRMMLDRSAAPNAETWVHLLTLVQATSPRNVKHIISTMRRHNLLASASAKIGVANVVVKSDLAAWLSRGESVFDFLGHYDKLWESKDWLDTRATNLILEVLLANGLIEDAFSVLEVLIQRGRRPNQVSLNILLGAAADHRDSDLAVAALEKTVQRFAHLQLLETAYERLARLAWRTRGVNTMRVVWRYACLNSQVSRRFIARMKRSLALPLPSAEDWAVGVGMLEESLSRHRLFLGVVAKVAVGVGGNEQVLDGSMATALHDKGTVASVHDDNTGATDSAPTPSASPDTPPRQPGLPSVLKSDLASAETYTPTTPFLGALKAAIARDEQWKQQGRDKQDISVEVLRTEAVDVEVERQKSSPGSAEGDVEHKKAG